MRKRVYVVISPHGYDFTLYCGGTLAKMAREGHAIHVLRVTDDSKRSLDLSVQETVEAHARESREAAEILGVSSFVDLGWREDGLNMMEWNDLRGTIVRYLRQFKPHAVFSFDPWAVYDEEMEHLLVARVVEDACRCCSMHLYHPEQLEGNLSLHVVAQRIYFGRGLSKINHVVDISEVIDIKAEAMRCQRTSSEYLVKSFLRRLDANGLKLPALAEYQEEEDLWGHLIVQFIRRNAAEVGRTAALKCAEGFRLDRFGDLEPFVEAVAEPIPEEESPHQEG